MTTFFDLFIDHSSHPNIRDDPAWADRQFPDRIAASPFHLWRPGDPIPKCALRILIGVATWSGYDMRLLDMIAESLPRSPIDPPVLDVFNTADCQQARDFAHYIPGADEVLQTPVVGYWRDAKFYSFMQGYAAREWVAGLFGSTSAEIVAFVQDWIKGQTPAH